MNQPRTFRLSSNAVIEDFHAHQEKNMLSAANIITFPQKLASYQTLYSYSILAVFVQYNQQQFRSVAHGICIHIRAMTDCFSGIDHTLFDVFCLLHQIKLHFVPSASSISFKNLKCNVKMSTAHFLFHSE